MNFHTFITLAIFLPHFQSRSKDMWSEITALQIGKKFFSRIKREWSFGKWMSDSFYENNGSGGGSGSGSSGSYDSIPISQISKSDPVMNANYYGHCCTCRTVNHLVTIFFFF